MSSRMIINVKEVNDIVIPDTSAPDTGMFSVSHNDGVNTVAGTIGPIVGVVAVVLILAVLIAKLAKGRKYKKTNKFSVYSSRRVVFRFTGILMVVLLSTLAVLKYGEQKDVANAETRASDGLSITTEDININVTLDDKPVFATTKSAVTVNAATTNGYTLMAYVDSNTSDLANETNTNATTKITGLESSYSQPLTENTWGVALSLPESQDASVFRGLPTKKEDAMMIKVTGSMATNANDTTELYYAAYVTPDLEEGTYTGATVNYVAVSNPTTNDDITVRYNTRNRNTGEYELFNTVTYGLDCSMVYIGGNCRKAYAGESVTVNAVDGDIGILPSFEDFDNLEGSLNPITFDGADGVKLAVDYRGEDYFYTIILKGAYPTMTSLITKMQEIMNTGGDLNDWIVGYFVPDMVDMTKDNLNEFYLSENTLTIISIPIDNGDYNDFNYAITPIFMSEPTDINVTKTTICGLADSSGTYSEVWENNIYLNTTRPITFPGADGLRVEINYDSPSYNDGDFDLMVIEGKWSGMSRPAKYWAKYSSAERSSGTEVLDYSGDTVTFYFRGSYSYTDTNNYGFSAKVYPIYDVETEDTTTTQVCKIVNKSGSYREPASFYGSWSGYDVAVFGLDEDEIKFALLNEYDVVRGRTIDLNESK